MTDRRQQEWATVRLGPAVVDAPSDWIVERDGSDGVVVLRMPLDETDLGELATTPGFVHPNLVLRYLESPPAAGGVAKTAADELVGALTGSKGSTVLTVAATPINGYPSRTQVIAGIHQRSPYQVDRWFIGVGDAVVEISLTLPAMILPDMVALGGEVACSIRLHPDAEAPPEPAHPAIPESLRDAVLEEHVRGLDTEQDLAPVESIASLLDGADRASLPGSSARIILEAADYLLHADEAGLSARFGSPVRPEILELQELGILTGTALTGKGRQIVSGVAGRGQLSLEGVSAGRTTAGDVWFDGDQATLLLGPTLADLRDGATGHIYVLRELALSVPTILAAWTRNDAAWFVDHSVRLSSANLDERLDGHQPGGGPEDLAAFDRELVGDGLTRWTCAAGGEEAPLIWFGGTGRGPLVPTEDTGDAVRLTTVSALQIHDEISRLAAVAAAQGG
ncbi:hypothetical protein [Zhihengliuella salsuginis]|uniref:Uncharacterized protein n=1 Tax=Zhihengliuella salsuginis TaxID=578222 RepID=A0ABQ3GI86_9MICC|nr:hypothetical protein [Zhihengliuella salsuginis]GHD05571.1 hypothetical protein GCM10008096_14660 [Zhihengliuella salsuginis]